ncbi:MAG TPA: GNAT family N-acyltransferase [Kiloniellaceae bacterium]|nr:GNAT family N-acyltransferase [Kiloniellaceae bacterium]
MTLQKPDKKRAVAVVAGNLAIRLAETENEVRAAQSLRYSVFYDEMAARPTPEMQRLKRDFDSFDDHCDHLLVFDCGPEAACDADGVPLADGKGVQVVGTYRVMRRSSAAAAGGFYSSHEYDIAPLLKYPGEILELGRSCVAPGYRNGATMTLLWRGIAAYVWHYNIEIMFGCASLPGTDIAAIGPQLGYLHRNHLAPASLRPKALPERYVEMERDLSAKELRRGLLRLPPLIKGYLRLGGVVGQGAVVDPDFGTTDICMIVRTKNVTQRYLNHYRRDEEPDDAVGTKGRRQG